MTYTYYPTIVILAYNRPHALKRLFYSLLLANYPTNVPVNIIISIDKCPDDVLHKEVVLMCNNFEWSFGTKQVIIRPERIGLRQHILAGGNFTATCTSVILLEDDVVVSPVFYDFSLQALNFYYSDPKIAGLSLYTHALSESSRNRFHAIDDDSDTYLMQFASWGHVWTDKQWLPFKEWYDKGQQIDEKLPPFLRFEWSEASWKKYYIQYLVNHNLYFACAKQSLVTNFGDAGTHFLTDMDIFQQPLQLANKNWKFNSLKNTKILYDVYFEPFASTVKYFVPLLNEYDLEIDLDGKKNPAFSDKAYFLTSQPVKNSIKSYSKQMFPLFLNVLFNIEGSGIYLCEKQAVLHTPYGYSAPLPLHKKIFWGVVRPVWLLCVKMGIIKRKQI